MAPLTPAQLPAAPARPVSALHRAHQRKVGRARSAFPKFSSSPALPSGSVHAERKRWRFPGLSALAALGAARASRARRAATATATAEGVGKRRFRLFAPIAFKQWTNWPTELGAGVTTAVVALPLAMAFGVTSGAGPLAGLYGAIFTGFFAALFGGTPAQVTGPTGPMAVVMATIFAQYGDPALCFAVVAMAGVLQIFMGMLKLGGVIRLVPRTVLSGFMTGIGGIIFSLQLPVMLGHSGGGQVVGALSKVPYALANVNLASLGIGLFTLFMLYKFPAKLTFNIPRPLLALVGASAFQALVVPILGVTVPCLGAIPQGLPMLQIPALTPGLFTALLPAAVTLAVLGAVDSLLTSLVSDSMTSSFHDSDRELVGQGIGNAVAGLFGGHAGAGATMRTVVNVRTGGRTPISGATHSVVLLAFVFGLGSLARYVPLSCLAAILIKSGADVVDWGLLKRSSKLPLSEVGVLAITFSLTVFVDLIVAVVAGWALAVLVYFFRASQLQLSDKGVQVFRAGDSGAPAAIGGVLTACPEAVVVRLAGSVTFGAAQSLLKKLVPDVVGSKAVVLEMSDVVMVDASAVLCLEELLEKCVEAGGKGYVCGARPDMEGYDLLTKLDLAANAANGSVQDPLAPALLTA